MTQLFNKATRSLTLRIVLIIAVVLSLTLYVYNTILINQSSQIVGDFLVTEVFEYDAVSCQVADECFDFIDIQDDGVFTSIQPTAEEIERLESSANSELRSVLLRDFLIVPILVAIFAGYIIARMVTQPHRRMNTALTKLIKDGRHQHIENSSIAEFDATINQYNALVDELEETEILRKDMVSDISHELRTPLTSATVMLHGMVDGVVPKTKKQLTFLQTELQKLEHTVDQFEQFVMMQKQAVKLDTEDVELKAFCQQAIGRVVKQADITLHLDITDDHKIKADKKLLSQILNNLTNNTIAYAGAKSIRITAKDNKITFSDDGQGVPKEHLKHLFERFYRVDKSRNKEYGGLGLGLAIVKQACERHGWSITSKSEAHHGLKFEIKLS